MKKLTIPTESTVKFLRESVLTLPAFRAQGKASLTIQILSALDSIDYSGVSAAGTPKPSFELPDDCHELLVQACRFDNVQLRPELVLVVASIQRWLESAE